MTDQILASDKSVQRSFANLPGSALRKLRGWLGTNLARDAVETFLHDSDIAYRRPTLEIGASDTPRRDVCNSLIAGDLSQNGSIDVVFDATNLPFRSGSLEQVLCLEMLEHCIRPDMVADEIHRVLRRHGALFLTTRFIYPIHDAPNDFFRFTEYGLRYLFREFSAVNVLPDTSSAGGAASLVYRLVVQRRFRSRIRRLALLTAAKALSGLLGSAATEYGDAAHKQPHHCIAPAGYHLQAIR